MINSMDNPQFRRFKGLDEDESREVSVFGSSYYDKEEKKELRSA